MKYRKVKPEIIQVADSYQRTVKLSQVRDIVKSFDPEFVAPFRGPPMSDPLDRDEREKRAFDALIVSNLLRDRDPEDLDDLPELPDAIKAKMTSLPDDLVSKLWAKTPGR